MVEKALALIEKIEEGVKAQSRRRVIHQVTRVETVFQIIDEDGNVMSVVDQGQMVKSISLRQEIDGIKPELMTLALERINDRKREIEETLCQMPSE